MKPRTHKPQSQRRNRQAISPGKASVSLKEVTQGRKWLFRLLAAVVIPLLLLGGLEAGLRLAGFGRSYTLFKTVRIGDRDYLVNNDAFSLQFFPPEMMRSPSAFRMEVQKPPGTCRIFILGESAGMGDPEPAYGAGRYLEVLLRERYPGVNFEIVNLGITAINSHVILPIARECARHEGDLWIVYMGNNEMVGPFGASTVFGAQAPPAWFVRLNLAIQRTRTGQLLAKFARKLKPAAPATTWGGMQMFVENKLRPDDPRREMVYRNFASNLRDIVRAGTDSGAKVLLSTVAVNLKDCPPFASLPGAKLSASDQDRFEQLCSGGAKAEVQGNFVEAARQFEQALTLDPQSAGAHFELASCRLRLNQFAEAQNHFQRACDLDALPFRADSRINGAIRETAANFSNDSLRLVDAAAALASNNPAGVCGQESFYEHVHFNFDGNYRLARAWAAHIEPMLPESITRRAAADWASQELCERRLALTDWNRGNIAEAVISRFYTPPLSSQSNNPQRIATLQARIAELRQRESTTAANEARETYVDAIRRAPDDCYLHENYAAFLVSMRDLPQAAAEWRRVHELMPGDFVADFQLGKLLASQGQLGEAQSLLNSALATHPGLAEGWLQLGEIHAAESKLELALDEFDHARRLRPDDPVIWTQRGMVLSRLKRSDESIASFREAIRARPDYWEAHYTLGGELGMHGQIADAGREFSEVIRLNPQHAGAHLNLGVALLKANKLEEAQREFEEALRLEPANKTAPSYLSQVLAMKTRQSGSVAVGGSQ